MTTSKTADRLLQIRPFGKDVQVYIDGSTCSIGTYSNSNYDTDKENNAIFVERMISNDQEKEDYIGLVVLKALKKIKQNDEILIDYGDDYWKEENNKKIMQIKESEELTERKENNEKILNAASYLKY